MRSRRKWLRGVSIFVLVLGLSSAIAAARHDLMADWRTASRAPTGIAPDPATTREAVIQVYGARAYNWRGYFGIHTWIAAKRSGAPAFRVYEVIGWRAYYGGESVVVSERPPDGRWFGAAPRVLGEVRGDGVDAMIDRLETAVRSYPYNAEYKVWPGPNSNTFTTHVARAVPELRLDLPPTAIGKDYIPGGRVVAEVPSGTGYQLSLYGLLGVMAAWEEGLELNLLGLTFGIDFARPALKLPMAGRLGAAEAPAAP